MTKYLQIKKHIPTFLILIFDQIFYFYANNIIKPTADAAREIPIHT